MNKYIETRLGNGLDTLNKEDEIDTIVISGMGAHTIIDILKNNLDKLMNIDTIIIQSNTKLELLRREITKINYYIEDEELLEENKKIYTIIKFRKGTKKYTKKEFYFGPILLNKNSELFKNINSIELSKLKKIIKQLPYYKLVDRYIIKKKISLYK